MNRSMSLGTLLAWLLLLLAWSPVNAEDAAATAEKPADQKPLRVRSPYKYLAPGVMVSIDPMQRLEETVSHHDMVGLLAVDPQFDWAKDVEFRHDIWVLKFDFKPMRIIWVDVPQPSGYMQRKPIWYMVYSVTNTGKMMHPVRNQPLPYETHQPKELFKVENVEQPIRFCPEFLLEGHQHMKGDEGFTKVYSDRVIPVAMDPIRKREDPARKFLTSVEMCREIPVGETFWGVATWEDLDPRIVRFSVYVFGLTNSYRWKDEPSELKADESLAARKRYRKVLKLNFWRPADQYHEHEEEIKFGVPDGVDYQWVYR